VKGQVLLLEKKKPLPYYVDDEFPETLSYVFTRSDGILIGGSAEVGLDDDLPFPEMLQTIRQRCENILPDLRGLKVLKQWAGHRPARPEIRLERVPDRQLIHNYGHGGSGYTLAWGCAASALECLHK
ncbi:MAG: FAD-binding oxidoreductase, partial [Phaeodactylibacter sp.]|nr:FAD-binding oxidoreductase [Phaeodactylibacter sp.]